MPVVVLVPDRPQGEYLVFCRERDPDAETWHGRRAGLEGACELYGADDAFPITDLDDILPGLLENKERIYYTMGRYVDFDQRRGRFEGRLLLGGIGCPHRIVRSNGQQSGRVNARQSRQVHGELRKVQILNQLARSNRCRSSPIKYCRSTPTEASTPVKLSLTQRILLVAAIPMILAGVVLTLAYVRDAKVQSVDQVVQKSRAVILADAGMSAVPR